MALAKFEQLCKMTRLGPEPLSTISGPPPVKFRPVYFNPSLDEEQDSPTQALSGDEFDVDEEMRHADLPINENGNHFYKNPLQPAFEKADDTSTADEESSISTSSKLGRNMRACGTKNVKGADKSVWGQMAARKQLLDEQRQQHVKHSKRETTDREAAALVNNLLQQGFHITPPDVTPRLTTTAAAAINHVTDDDMSDVVSVTSAIRHEGDLVKSIHKELKRVQGVGVGSATGTAAADEAM